MNDILEKEEFLREIHTLPCWVKNGDDLLKFCKHIQYRLLQAKAINQWCQNNLDMQDEDLDEILKIQKAYDDAYNQDVSKFQSFEQIFI